MFFIPWCTKLLKIALNIFFCYTISGNKDGANSRNTTSRITRTSMLYLVKAIVTDDLATKGASTPAALVLAWMLQYVSCHKSYLSLIIDLGAALETLYTGMDEWGHTKVTRPSRILGTVHTISVLWLSAVSNLCSCGPTSATLLILELTYQWIVNGNICVWLIYIQLLWVLCGTCVR